MVKADAEARPTSATVSMTGFAARQGAGANHDWAWEIRAVNGKGLDLRVRLPEIPGLEQGVRQALASRLRRGTVTISLRLNRVDGSDGLRLDPRALEQALDALGQVAATAAARGLALATPSAAEIVTLRGVIAQGQHTPEDPAELCALLLADVAPLLDDFQQMRASEGAVIGAVIADQVARIAALTEEAAQVAEARRPEVARALNEALGRVMEGAPGADPDRVAQELALIAVKSDVTEEIDRLRAHVSAAEALLVEPGPVGRKFDFLAQEFVREANTLCSKSGDAALTRIGLALKHAIDQMREQIQNVE